LVNILDINFLPPLLIIRINNNVRGLFVERTGFSKGVKPIIETLLQHKNITYGGE